jgi:hypothetical protein
VLHVLSRAVFGEVASIGFLKRPAEYSAGLWWALSFGRFELARSFNLPVRQLEGQRGGEARARKNVLGRRTHSYAVWLTVVWVHFEWVLLWSAAGVASLLLPAQAERARGDEDAVFGSLLELMQIVSVEDVLVFAGVIFLLEPFYVAAGFALYLNRRTLLEGWDIEVALRRIAERHATALLLVFCVLALPLAAHAQEKDPKQEIAEVLKAKEFGYYKDVKRWQSRDKSETREDGSGWDLRWVAALGQALAKAGEILLWVGAAAMLAYALWWAARMLPSLRAPPREPYRPPAALFGMDLAPETLPADVGAAAAALAREGRLREALGLLYRGALSELVHRRGVRLLASHTEGEAVALAKLPYFAALVDAWRQCAYARRMPPAADVERLAGDYRSAFA